MTRSDVSEQAVGAPPSAHPAIVEHQLPGRIRIKIPRAVRRPELLGRYADAFARIAQVREVSANPTTGCVVLYYDKDAADTFPALVAQKAAEERLRLLPQRRQDHAAVAAAAAANAELLSGHSEVARSTMEFFNGLDLELRHISGNSLDLNVALVGSLAVFTFMGIGAAASTPMWVTLALFGINHAVRLQSEGLAKVPAPAGLG